MFFPLELLKIRVAILASVNPSHVCATGLSAALQLPSLMHSWFRRIRSHDLPQFNERVSTHRLQLFDARLFVNVEKQVTLGFQQALADKPKYKTPDY
jgi:hypothetical protein